MASSIPTTHPNDETSGLFEIQQYAKIVQFCETVFSGRHPTVRPVMENGSKLPGDPEFNARIELQLQRKKLEQSLREDVELRKASKPAQFERPPNFDLADILAKAMALTGSDQSNLTGANEPATDDSTFYSSVFETPDSNLASIVRNKSAELQAPPPLPGERDDERSLDTAGSSSGNGYDERHVAAQPTAAHRVPQHDAHAGSSFVVPGLNSYANQQPRDMRRTGGRDDYMDVHPPSPLLRAAANHQIPVYPPAVPNVPSHGAPAQVAALRQRPASAGSTHSSSDGRPNPTGKGKKSKKSKSKRKASGPGLQVEQSPLIKAEPRSPSPFAGPSSIRPTKRQRHSQGNARGRDAADEAGYASASQARPHEQQMQRVPSGYDPTQPLLAPEPRYPPESVERRWVAREDHNAPVRYVESDPYGSRINTHMAPDHQYRGQSQYNAGPTGPPEAVRYDVPPGATYYYESAPTRIYVDASGREYIEPPRPAVRQSVAPPSHGGYYEAVPPRTASHQPRQCYDDNSAYDRLPSPFASHRRIITEPEHVVREQPSRYRDYTAHAGANRERFVEVVPQHRQYGDAAGSYIRRATSMMPMEAQPAGPYERLYRPGPDGARDRDGQRVQPQQDFRAPYAAYEAGPTDQRVLERFSVAPGYRRHDEPAYADQRRSDGRQIVYTDSNGREVVYR